MGKLGAIVLLVFVTTTAVGGTATFTGSAQDSEAQLIGDSGWKLVDSTTVTAGYSDWLKYEADGISSYLQDAEWGFTTNITTLCGSRSLPEFGTFTVLIESPNTFWGSWYGAWLEVQISVGTEHKIGFGFGPEWDWWDGSCPAYIQFGTQTDNDRPRWLTSAMGGAMPLGIRLVSDGTTLTLLASTDGATFFVLPGGSWPINNLPGGLGDMTSGGVNVEVAAYCVTPTISTLEWTAATVPDINQGEPDADGDGLPDSVETNTGIYVDGNDTGTDPNNPDTDGDGLSDGVESDTGTYGGPSNTGTDPNIADTDGDGVSDGTEITFGSDPTNNADFPSLPVAGLLGVGVLALAFGLGGARSLLRKRKSM